MRTDGRLLTLPRFTVPGLVDERLDGATTMSNVAPQAVLDRRDTVKNSGKGSRRMGNVAVAYYGVTEPVVYCQSASLIKGGLDEST